MSRGTGMAKAKRERQERTDNWKRIQQWCRWPEQRLYESIRPIVLYGDPAVQRAKETGEARHTLERKADAFDEQGMVSVFASKPRKQKWVAGQRRTLGPDGWLLAPSVA